MVERRGLLMALLPAALGCSCLAAALTAIQPQTRSWSLAGAMVLLTALSIFLAGAATHFHAIRYPLALRLLLVAIAIKQGLDVAWASAVLSDRYHAAWLGLAALAAAGVVLATVHVALYRSPPKPEPDTRAFEWPANG